MSMNSLAIEERAREFMLKAKRSIARLDILWMEFYGLNRIRDYSPEMADELDQVMREAEYLSPRIYTAVLPHSEKLWVQILIAMLQRRVHEWEHKSALEMDAVSPFADPQRVIRWIEEYHRLTGIYPSIADRDSQALMPYIGGNTVLYDRTHRLNLHSVATRDDSEMPISQMYNRDRAAALLAEQKNEEHQALMQEVEEEMARIRAQSQSQMRPQSRKGPRSRA